VRMRRQMRVEAIGRDAAPALVFSIDWTRQRRAASINIRPGATPLKLHGRMADSALHSLRKDSQL
jgi:hypothetical protein